MITDIHTHHEPTEAGRQAIVSLSVGEEGWVPSDILEQHPHTLFSIGLHPWHVHAHWAELIDERMLPLISSHQVVAIGEAGLDRIRGGAWSLQVDAFVRQAQLAAQMGKPLIVHCVKAFDELIRLHRELFSKEKWIIHGFRGKGEQAAQLLHHGFALSFGEHYHAEALLRCPMDCLFMETDESGTPIQELYRRAALLFHIEPDELVERVQENICKWFLSFPSLPISGSLA